MVSAITGSGVRLGRITQWGCLNVLQNGLQDS
jgi:hypothetical protein